MKNKNIMYFTRKMGLGGTEKVILQLCENHKDDFNKIIVCSAPGINVENLKKFNIEHFQIDDIENKNPKVILKTFIKIFKIVKKEKIDVIHTQHRMAAFYTRILSFFLKVEFIHTAHNTFNDKKFFTKFSLKNANIIAVGNKVKENLVDFYNIKDEKVQVIYNAIEKDSSEIDIIHEIQKYRDSNKFLVGNIGRLNEQKGMKYFIESLKRVKEYTNDIIYFIVGEGEDREELEAQASKLNVLENVVFLGYRNDIMNVMKQLDLIVLSSLWEGLPLTVIEAFSVGKTVIGTKVDGTPEIITNDYDGILIEPKDEEAIYEKVKYLFENKEKVKELEENALKTYSEKFTINRLKENYGLFYKKILG